MYIPEKRKNHQITLFDFNQSCGMELDPDNEWIRLADAIPWNKMETGYAALFPSDTGRPATPFRMALGVLIIQKRKKLSDRAVIKEIQENPYLQYFLGMEKFSRKVPIQSSFIVSFRKRLTAECLMEANEYILEISGATKEHEPENESRNAKAANTRSDDMENLGTEILDATCSPSNIRYPQDFSLLNEGCEKLEDMIDYFHKNFHPWDKPRTYRRIARKEYLALAKSKRRTEKKIRSRIRKQLGYVRRDLWYLEDYMKAGYALPSKHMDCYLTIRRLDVPRRKKATNYSVPYGVKNIADHCFADCYRIKAVTMPDTVTKVGNQCFIASGIKKIRLSSNLKFMGESAMYRTKLTEVVFPGSMVQIPESCLGYCKSLKKVTIRPSVKRVRGYAFVRCENLKKVIIPPSVKNFSVKAFVYISISITLKQLTIYAKKTSYAYKRLQEWKKEYKYKVKAY